MKWRSYGFTGDCSFSCTNDGRLRQFRRLGGLNIFNLFGLELEFKLWLTSDLVFVVLDWDAQER